MNLCPGSAFARVDASRSPDRCEFVATDCARSSLTRCRIDSCAMRFYFRPIKVMQMLNLFTDIFLRRVKVFHKILLKQLDIFHFQLIKVMRMLNSFMEIV
jgi:hypothetical protein